MENKANEYEPGIDQNQGVVGTMARNEQHDDTESEGTQLPELDPNMAANQLETGTGDGEDKPSTDNLGERKYVNDQGVD